jgi:L-rhamnose mutarotase
VRGHRHANGVLGMAIYLMSTRLFMVMELNPAVCRSEAMAEASLANTAIERWEALM